MKYAKFKYGELELSAIQPQTPAAALGTVAMAADTTPAPTSQGSSDDSRPTGEVAPTVPAGVVTAPSGGERLPVRVSDELGEFKQWVSKELDRRQREVSSWKNLFLDRFLVDAARSVLGWLRNFKAVPEKFYDSSWTKLIPDKDQRDRVLQVLTEMALVRRMGGRVALSEEGRRYLEHVYSAAVASGKQLPLPHPYVSAADLRAYGGELNPHIPAEGKEDDGCHHTYSPAAAASTHRDS